MFMVKVYVDSSQKWQVVGKHGEYGAALYHFNVCHECGYVAAIVARASA